MANAKGETVVPRPQLKLSRLTLERIAATVRGYGKAAGLTLDEEFAARLGVSRATLFNLAGEKPHGRHPSRATTDPNLAIVQRLSQLTGVSVDWMLGFEVPKDRSERQQVGALRGALRAHIVRLVEGGVRLSPFVKGFTDYDDLVPPEPELLGEIEELFVGRAKRSARHLNKSFIRDLRRSLKAGLAKRKPHP